MRYGILSDIHGNLEALEAVLHELAHEKISQFICCGDIVGYGADPSRCIRLLERLPCANVAGNHDWAVSDLFDPVNLNEVAREAVLWTEAVISWDEIGFLKSLDIVLQRETFTAVHGTLSAPEDFDYLLSEDEAVADFKKLKTRFLFVGHTHVPTIFICAKDGVKLRRDHHVRLAPGCSSIVNVGSVGQPRDGDPRAACAIFDDEAMEVQIKRVPYDIKKAQDKILKAGLPSILAYRLKTGS